MPWIQTFTGRKLDLLTPCPADVSLADITVALGRLPRFCGHTAASRVWSVADHSILTARLLRDPSPRMRMLTLLHDAHEYATGDIATPLKRALRQLTGCDALGVMQDRLQEAIHAAAGIEGPTEDEHAAIKYCDRLALAIEKRDLMLPEPFPWNVDLPEIPEDAPKVRDVWGAAESPRVEDMPGTSASGFVMQYQVRLLIRAGGFRPLGSFDS